MTILDTSARRWNQTPARLVTTTVHRVRPRPGLSAAVLCAQQVQSSVYDATIEHLMRHPGKRWIVSGASGDDSVLKWLTRERRQHEESKTLPLVIARGAARQAHDAFQRWDKHQQAKALTLIEEAEAEAAIGRGEAPHPNDVDDLDERARHEPRPALVRRWTKPPTTLRYRGAGRRTMHLLVPCRQVAATEVHVPGVGRVHLREPVPEAADIRSCQLVETTRRDTPTAKRRYALHLQCGAPVPETADDADGDVGIDLGVATTIALSTGAKLHRPDLGAELLRARDLMQHASRRCKRGSRRYHKLRRQAKRIRRLTHQANENWERHAARDIVDEAALIGIEALALRNMTASGRGTPSAPGSDAKHGLNRRLAEQRLGKLGTSIARRAAKTGTDLVAVHPGKTSITCNACGHVDRASRKAQAVFECTACGHQAHADVNAACNVRDRARPRLHAFHERQQANQGRRGPSSRSGGSKGQGLRPHRTMAVQLHSAYRQPTETAGPQKDMTTRPKTGRPNEVESCM